METVYLLWHVRGDDEYKENAKLIGVFPSDDLARAATVTLRLKPGFREHPDGFEIKAYELGQVHWQDGFGVE